MRGRGELKHKAGRAILLSQFFILLLFLLMTFLNEMLDIPHYLLGDAPTSVTQRIGEMFIELFVFVVVVSLEVLVINYLLKRIRILEGFLPMCSNCKKIRCEDQWQQIEEYITDHSLARFSHSMCPDCLKKLYPELYPSNDLENIETIKG
jgi:hypothetical protein